MQNFIIDQNDFRVVKSIGKGKYGHAFLINNKKTNEKFAAKVNQKKCIRAIDQKMFFTEIQTYFKVKYPTILTFFGYNMYNFDFEPFPMIITEYMPQGSLDKMLQNAKFANAPIEWTDTKRYIELLGIALGMHYLHLNGIVHRDLKPGNVLLDENFYPKICDFGFSKMTQEQISELLMSSKLGTQFYMAPEILTDEKYNYKVDSFAFGRMAYEMILLEQWPIDISKIEGEENQRFIRKCISSQPSKRPNFKEICYFIVKKSFIDLFGNVDYIEVSDFLDLFEEDPSDQNLINDLKQKIDHLSDKSARLSSENSINKAQNNEIMVKSKKQQVLKSSGSSLSKNQNDEIKLKSKKKSLRTTSGSSLNQNQNDELKSKEPKVLISSGDFITQSQNYEIRPKSHNSLSQSHNFKLKPKCKDESLQSASRTYTTHPLDDEIKPKSKRKSQQTTIESSLNQNDEIKTKPKEPKVLISSGDFITQSQNYEIRPKSKKKSLQTANENSLSQNHNFKLKPILKDESLQSASRTYTTHPLDDEIKPKSKRKSLQTTIESSLNQNDEIKTKPIKKSLQTTIESSLNQNQNDEIKDPKLCVDFIFSFEKYESPNINDDYTYKYDNDSKRYNQKDLFTSSIVKRDVLVSDRKGHIHQVPKNFMKVKIQKNPVIVPNNFKDRLSLENDQFSDSPLSDGELSPYDQNNPIIRAKQKKANKFHNLNYNHNHSSSGDYNNVNYNQKLSPISMQFPSTYDSYNYNTQPYIELEFVPEDD